MQRFQLLCLALLFCPNVRCCVLTPALIYGYKLHKLIDTLSLGAGEYPDFVFPTVPLPPLGASMTLLRCGTEADPQDPGYVSGSSSVSYRITVDSLDVSPGNSQG